MGARLRTDQVAHMADGTRAVAREPAFGFVKDNFVAGYMEMQAAIAGERVEDFLATGCPVVGVFRKLARKDWGVKDFDEPAPVKFWFYRQEH